ncbi:SdiA-regulated domain-containing protein [Verrucomicrobiota bacterium]
MKSGALDIKVSADMLKDAVSQIKELTRLRQQEAERQKLVIAEMQESIRGNARSNRLLLWLGVVALLALVLLGIRFNRLTGQTEEIGTELETVGRQLVADSGELRVGVAKQIRQIAGVRQDVGDTRAAQAEMAVRLEKRVESSRDAIENRLGETGKQQKEIAGKIDTTLKRQGLLFKKIDKTAEAAREDRNTVQSALEAVHKERSTAQTALQAVREERSSAQTALQTVLEDRTRALAQREARLRNKEEDIRREADRALEQRQEIMREAIDKLAEIGNTLSPEATPPEEIETNSDAGLDQYKLRSGPIEVAGISENLSGLTFNPNTGTLFAVVNAPARIVELELDGTPGREIPLNGFEDTEDITYVGGSTFALVEERRRTMCLVEIGEDTASVEYAEAEKMVVDPEAAENVGIEGLSYDFLNKRFFMVKEKDPRRIYVLSREDVGGEPDAVVRPWDIEENSLGLDDLSAVHCDAESGHLFILSHESMCLVESTEEGAEISRLALSAGSAGLAEDVPQAEGVAMDDVGNLFICSEPNLIYVFSKAP